MSQYDLIDFEWRVIKPLLPNKPPGVARVDDRRVLNGGSDRRERRQPLAEVRRAGFFEPALRPSPILSASSLRVAA